MTQHAQGADHAFIKPVANNAAEKEPAHLYRGHQRENESRIDWRIAKVKRQVRMRGQHRNRE